MQGKCLPLSSSPPSFSPSLSSIVLSLLLPSSALSFPSSLPSFYCLRQSQVAYPSWPLTQDVAEDGFEISVFPLLPPMCWDYRCSWQFLFYPHHSTLPFFVEIFPQISSLTLNFLHNLAFIGWFLSLPCYLVGIFWWILISEEACWKQSFRCFIFYFPQPLLSLKSHWLCQTCFSSSKIWAKQSLPSDCWGCIIYL